MKKFLLNIILFSFFALIFYISSVFLWKTYSPFATKTNILYNKGKAGHSFSRFSEVKKTKDIDILFLGSSAAYRSFDTRMYSEVNLKTFNLGSSGQTPIQTNVLIHRYLEKLNPKLIIFEVNPLVFSLDGAESSLDIISNDKNDFYSFEMAFKINNIKTYNTLIYAAMNDLLNRDKYFKEPIKRDLDTYISCGFVEREISYFKNTSFEKKNPKINKSQLASFSKVISLLKSENIEVILVNVPIPHANFNSYSNIEYFDSLMSTYSPYYNFNELVNLDDSLHFYDAHHMNQLGVEVFNEKLIEIIKER